LGLLQRNARNPSELPVSNADPCGLAPLVQVVLRKLENAGRDTAVTNAAIVKRSVRIAGHATSISLEAAFWQGLCDIAAARRVSVNALLAAIDAARDGNLSSAIRLFVLDGARNGELTKPAAGVRLEE
jgi:predicted DNA-binding ribbon-helix-helix protein